MPETASQSNDAPVSPPTSEPRNRFDPLTVSLVGVVAGVLIAVAPWGWDAFGPLRWLVISTFGFLAITAACSRPIVVDRVVMVFGALIAWLAIAAITGVDKLHAWIGTPDRHFGALTWVLCLGVFVAARSLVPSGREIVLRSISIAGLVAGGYALLESVDWAPVDISFASDRLGGTFGQPALLGASMALIAPICLGMALDSEVERGWRKVSVIAAGATMFALLGSQARAAWVGIAVAAAVVLWAQRKRLTGSPLALAGAVAATAVIALVTPVGARATSLFDRGGVSAGRFDEWQVAIRALNARPLLGYGPEGYRIAFGRHVDTEYVVAHGREVLTDRAHAGALDVAVTGGWTTGILYVGLVVLVGGAAWRCARDAVRASHIGVAAGVIAYLAQQQFLFPLAEVDPLLWVGAGLMWSSVPPSAAPHEAADRPRLVSVPAAVRGVFLGLAVLAFVAGTLDVLADRQVASALAASSPGESTDHADRARKLRGDSIRYDFISSRVWADHSPTESIARLDDGLRISPADPALRGERARRLLDQARASGSAAELDVAINALEAVVRDDSKHPEHVLRLGVGYALRSEHAEITAEQRQLDLAAAEGAFRQVITLAPENAVAERNLALLLEEKEKDR